MGRLNEWTLSQKSEQYLSDLWAGCRWVKSLYIKLQGDRKGSVIGIFVSIGVGYIA